MSINTFPSAIVMFAVVLLIIGAISGLSISGSELINPFSATAQLERDRVETRYLEQQRQVDMDYYAQSRQIELEALREKYQQELHLAAERQQQEMERLERRERIINGLLPIIIAIVLLAVLVISGGMTYCLVCAGRGRLMAARFEADRRTAMRQQARRREREMRQQEIDLQNRLRTLFAPTVSPNGRTEAELAVSPSATLRSHN